jgi:hypothetical protein
MEWQEYAGQMAGYRGIGDQGDPRVPRNAGPLEER